MSMVKKVEDSQSLQNLVTYIILTAGKPYCVHEFVDQIMGSPCFKLVKSPLLYLGGGLFDYSIHLQFVFIRHIIKPIKLNNIVNANATPKPIMMALIIEPATIPTANATNDNTIVPAIPIGIQ